MIELFKDATLAQNRLNLILIENAVFAENLDSIQPACVFLAREDDSAEPTTTDYTHLFEVFDRDILPLRQACL